MAVLSKIVEKATPKNSAIAAGGVVAFYWLLQKTKKKPRKVVKDDDEPAFKVVLAEDKQRRFKDKAAVDATFFKRIVAILKILVPNFFSPETGFLSLVGLSLIIRTYCDVWMIQNGTAIESAIIGRDMSLFKKHLFKFIYAMPGIALINNMLKFGLNELKLRFRTRLTYYLYNKYLNGFTYYKMSNLDNRISNPDQLLTQDVERFCNSIADLYSNLSKPILDIIIYSVRLAGAIGAQGPGWMLLYLAVSGLILTRVRRPIGKMTVQEQRFEGEFRYVNSRLITNSEEVAFYQGQKREKATIIAEFAKLVKHLRDFISFRFNMGMVDSLVAKYCAMVVGYISVSRPFLDLAHPRHMNSSHTERLEDYYKSGRMLVRMAEAIGRVVLAGREMTRLAGFTQRITELNRVLDDLNKGKYERTMVSDSRRPDDGAVVSHRTSLKPGSGMINVKDYIINFDRVPLVTPNGDVLIDEMSFEVKSGVNVLVCGPNGCGKSSLFRILGELWPLFGGTLTKPAGTNLFYIPQRPYMTLGTLRDQVIYPDNHKEQKNKNIADDELKEYLDKVQLGYILEREGGWDATQDWMDVLSGGEKQRIAMARLFYHKPQFAILDECTSAVSVDVEGYMYQHCREVGITLFTVSHRKSLWKHHAYYLHMDGRGAYEFKEITSDTQEFGS
ncbi:ATP-binding cassette sub-family D member 3-like isoform X2 [Lineus longissimus]|uniref:ATP-binding cassette sub-family D member 3-like isoform X2 n=1 Tax=Lineus longissimus TaxID=88925 RepID=UPI002B4EB4F3